MELKIAPSLLSADFADLTSAVRGVEAGGAKYLHFDIMDGHFVPNITFGPMVLRALRPLTDMHFLTHLMIEHPENYIDQFVEAGADSLTVHVEACNDLRGVIQRIKSAGIGAGVALNPATPISSIEYILGEIDILLIMTVNPGFGGQAFIEATLPKIVEARRLVEQSGREIDIAVDGGIDFNTCRKVVDAGANLLISGNTVFANGMSIPDAIQTLSNHMLTRERPG